MGTADPSENEQIIWIPKLLLYTTLFHDVILWAYGIYCVYIFFSSKILPRGPHLIYGILTIWVSLMFSWFIIQGISQSVNYQHLRCGLFSITLITVYILWWYIVFEPQRRNPSDALIEILCIINIV